MMKHRALLLLTVLAAFGAGYLAHGMGLRFHPSAATAVPHRAGVVDEPRAPATAVASEPRVPPAHRLFDSALLPLVMDTIVVAGDHGITAGAGGGIAVVGDDIVIVDRLGAVARMRHADRAIEALGIPAPPSRIDDYNRFAATRTELRVGFSVHDVAARTEPGGIRLFVSYERFLPEQKTTALAVSAILVSADRLAPLGPWEDIYQGQPLVAEWYGGVAGGGRMVVTGDTLYLTVGDYNQDNVFMRSALAAQNPDTDFGKILAIDLGTRQKSIVSTGHRNPQGLLITSTGTMLSTEHGPRGGDELNRIVRGRNYGWPIATYGTHYTTYDWPNRAVAHPGTDFESPLFAWVPSVAVSNLIEIVNFNPAWDGDLLVGSLKASSLYRVRRDADGRVVYRETIWIGERIRDLAALPDGTVVLWTDDGHVIFLAVDALKLASNSRQEATVNDASLAGCVACHHIGPTYATSLAPSLSKVFDRPIASDSFDHYLVALQNRSGSWTRDNLLELLADPGVFALGPAHKAESQERARATVEALRRLD